MPRRSVIRTQHTEITRELAQVQTIDKGASIKFGKVGKNSWISVYI